MAKAPATTTGAAPAKRKDTRSTLTLKGDFTPELRARINAAAKRLRMSQSRFVTDALSHAAERVLKGEALEETAPVPALRDDELTAALAAIQQQLDTVTAGLSAVEAREAAARRPGLWGRVLAVFRPRATGE